MNKILENPLLILVIRLFIGITFIFYVVSKIADPALFAEEIGNYDMSPELINNILAIIFPWLELIVGVMLVFGVKIKENAFISTLMLIVFTIAVVIAAARGLDISCGCSGGSAQEKVGIAKILKNTGLIVLSLFLTFSKSEKFNLNK